MLSWICLAQKKKKITCVQNKTSIFRVTGMKFNYSWKDHPFVERISYWTWYNFGLYKYSKDWVILDVVEVEVGNYLRDSVIFGIPKCFTKSQQFKPLIRIVTYNQATNCAGFQLGQSFPLASHSRRIVDWCDPRFDSLTTRKTFEAWRPNLRAHNTYFRS